MGDVDFLRVVGQQQYLESDENLYSVTPDPGDAKVEKPAEA